MCIYVIEHKWKLKKPWGNPQRCSWWARSRGEIPKARPTYFFCFGDFPKAPKNDFSCRRDFPKAPKSIFSCYGDFPIASPKRWWARGEIPMDKPGVSAGFWAAVGGSWPGRMTNFKRLFAVLLKSCVVFNYKIIGNKLNWASGSGGEF